MSVYHEQVSIGTKNTLDHWNHLSGDATNHSDNIHPQYVMTYTCPYANSHAQFDEVPPDEEAWAWSKYYDTTDTGANVNNRWACGGPVYNNSGGYARIIQAAEVLINLRDIHNEHFIVDGYGDGYGSGVTAIIEFSGTLYDSIGDHAKYIARFERVIQDTDGYGDEDVTVLADSDSGLITNASPQFYTFHDHLTVEQVESDKILKYRWVLENFGYPITGAGTLRLALTVRNAIVRFL